MTTNQPTTHKTSRLLRLAKASTTALAVAFVGTTAISPATAQAAGVSTSYAPVTSAGATWAGPSPTDMPIFTTSASSSSPVARTTQYRVVRTS